MGSSKDCMDEHAAAAVDESTAMPVDHEKAESADVAGPSRHDVNMTEAPHQATRSTKAGQVSGWPSAGDR